MFVSANRLFILAAVKSFNCSMSMSIWNGNLKRKEVMTGVMSHAVHIFLPKMLCL